MPKLIPFPVLSLLRLTDEQVMHRLQTTGDEVAFTRLLQRWEAPIRRLCARMSGDEHLAQDLAQETFTRVYARRHLYRRDGKFSTWLWRIALNLCHDEARRRQRRAEASDRGEAVEAFLAETSDEGRPAPDQAAVGVESVRLVRHALQRLPEPLRIVLVLRHYESLKFREIAELLEIPEGTVKSRMTEALRQLARLLRPNFGPPASCASTQSRPCTSPRTL